MNNTKCKYCSNTSVFPDAEQNLRNSIHSDKGALFAHMFQAKEDKEFEKIINGEYCCLSARYEAYYEYKKYFPYHGMAQQQWHIDVIKRDIIALAEMMRDLTPEKYGLITAEAESRAAPDERWEIIRNIKVCYEELKELAENTKRAYERETDPKRRKLLDGRVKEKEKNNER